MGWRRASHPSCRLPHLPPHPSLTHPRCLRPVRLPPPALPRSLVHFGTADLSRLPASLKRLQADLYSALPLSLPPGLHLEQLDIAAARLLVDWPTLCSQVRRCCCCRVGRQSRWWGLGAAPRATYC